MLGYALELILFVMYTTRILMYSNPSSEVVEAYAQLFGGPVVHVRLFNQKFNAIL